ncbi:bud site selection protein [Coemansia biformis]|uniref:Bud site selection protein n=1 Tax=Coemansia biformis TaxID=1286918 RepID=A0A9W7YAQ9_9FUNG|nr:bud site selection protein [Coemansia biformis]
MAYNDCLQDVPDIFENEIGESLGSRTESLGMIRELGPPDLCHIVKIHSSNRNEADIGSYHHVLGVDTSSSASLAAYINSLQYSLSDKPGWFGATNAWKIASGTYCAYNAFSKVDLRVQIKIPGGVDAFAISPQGERREVTEEMWKECHVSSILRAILYSDPATYSVTGLRRLTLVANPRDETRVVEALMEQFHNGWHLGSNAETQVASLARNYLADGLMGYFAGQGRFIDCASEILSPLAYAPLGGKQEQPGADGTRAASLEFKGVDPEVASLLAEAYMNGDEEVQAVRVMHQALKAKPSCYPILHTQAEFLRRKKQLASARTIALMAVKYAPSEFQAWARLTEVYIDDGDYESALLSLNTCPMYTYVDRDYPRVPTPRRINYPVKSDVLSDYNLGDNFTNGNYGSVPSGPRPSNDSDAPGVAEEIAQNETSFILRLSAPTLKGTFAHAYKLLTSIVGTIGWDELLLLRSNVFVMEEEYRNSVVPNMAVDDEEDDDDDHVPLSALRDCNSSSSAVVGAVETTTCSAAAPSAAPATVAEPAPEVTTSEAHTPGVQESEPVPDSVEAEKGEPEDAPASADKAPADDPEKDKPADDKLSNGKQEEEDKAPEPSAPADQPKGKKKNKRNKGKKTKENLMASEAGDTVGNVDADAAETTEEAKQNESAGAEAASQPAVEPSSGLKNSAAEGTSIAVLGSTMEDVSLSDNDDHKDAASGLAEQKLEEGNDQVAAPQLAAREVNVSDDVAEQQPEAVVGTAVSTAANDWESESEAEDAPHMRKRLCERWLDNLIMILFDDLRTYTNWRTKMHSLRATGQPIMHQFTQAEWEALGDLALRLRRPSEAREAYEYALSIRFSAKAWLRLLEMHTGTYAQMQKDEVERHDGVLPLAPLASTDALIMALDAAVWLAVYNDRWYNNMAYPNPLCSHIIKLVNIHGLSKVHNTLISMNLRPAVFSILKAHLDVAEKFEVAGTKW